MASSLLSSLPPPLTVWGLLPRGLGLVFCICLLDFSVQLVPLAGRHGLNPLAEVLGRYKRDFGWRAYFYFPTLFWLSASDTALWLLPLLGALCGLGAVVGGPLSPLCLLGAWATLLSIDAGPSGAVYPWDSVLLEAGFLSLWLPGTEQLSLQGLQGLSSAGSSLSSAVQALSLPSPLLAFAFRWLLFRVLLGFGKLKFVGSGWRDRLYIKNFVINQPMVSPLGWLAHHAVPDAAWTAMLGQMLVVEMLCPFLLFLPGLPRLLAGASIAGLMAGIWATGNYGYFNLLTAVLCLPALDTAAALSFSAADLLPAELQKSSLASSSAAGGGGA